MAPRRTAANVGLEASASTLTMQAGRPASTVKRMAAGSCTRNRYEVGAVPRQSADRYEFVQGSSHARISPARWIYTLDSSCARANSAGPRRDPRATATAA
jgi:hypothetical protein